MLFPVSGVETNPAVPFLVALVVSTFTSMGGISGAFLLFQALRGLRADLYRAQAAV
jgi:hypothetical protein